MSFTPNYAVSQGSNVTTFTLTDTSVGSDVLIVSRHIKLELYDGSYLVPSGTTTDYINWPIVNLTWDAINLAVLKINQEKEDFRWIQRSSTLAMYLV